MEIQRTFNSLADNIKYIPLNQETDMEALHRMFNRAIQSYIATIYHEEEEWPEEKRNSFFKNSFKERNMQIILDKEKIIGSFCIKEEESSILLQRMYLDPDYQKRGIGKAIVNIALQKAHNTQKPQELKVRENNLPAVNAYKKYGYVMYRQAIEDGHKKLLMRHKDTEQYIRPTTPT